MYDVVLLVEQELSEADAKQVVALHEEMPEKVKYHVVIPCHNAEAGVEASLAALGTADLYGAGIADQRADLAEAQRALDEEAEGGITHERAIDALVQTVKHVDGQEVIILTRPHVVAEFFHVDWSAQARRHLGVPVLHLLEQEEKKAG